MKQHKMPIIQQNAKAYTYIKKKIWLNQFTYMTGTNSFLTFVGVLADAVTVLFHINLSMQCKQALLSN